MRRLLGSVLAVLLLAGPLAACGDDDGGGTATDEPTATTEGSTPTASESPTKGGGTGDPVDFELVKMITETAAGGSTSETAVALDDDDAVAQFTSQFENDAMTRQVQNAVAETDVADDERLYGAVVAIGCDAPTDVTVISTDSGLVITALKVPSPQQECFAAMTTVSLVLVPASVVE